MDDEDDLESLLEMPLELPQKVCGAGPGTVPRNAVTLDRGFLSSRAQSVNPQTHPSTGLRLSVLGVGNVALLSGFLGELD